MCCGKNRYNIAVLLLGLALTACGKQEGQNGADGSGTIAKAQTEVANDLQYQDTAQEVLGTLRVESDTAETEGEEVDTFGAHRQEADTSESKQGGAATDVITVYTTEKPLRSDQKIPVVYTDELSLLEQLGPTDCSYAYQDGNVYYRQYHEDSYEEGALWGNYQATAGTDKEIVRINADGEKTVLFTDQGYGDIYLMGNRFYMKEMVSKKNGDLPQSYPVLYSVDMQGQNRVDYGEQGFVCFADWDRNCIVMKFYMEDTQETVYKVLNTENDELTALPLDTDGYCTFWDYHDGWCYFEEDCRNGVFRIVAVSLEGKIREIIALSSDRETEEYGYREYICDLRVDGERIYIVFGGYAGSGNFYQGGRILTTKLDGSDYRAIECSEDHFFVRQEQGRPLVYFMHHRYDDGEQVADDGDDYETTVWDVEKNMTYPCDFPYQLIYTLDKKLTITGQPGYARPMCVYQSSAGQTDFYALPDDSGRIVRAAIQVDRDILQRNDGEEYEIDYQHLYYADGYLYFEAEFNIYDSEYAIGWRDGYRRIQTDVYRRRLADGKMELLYSY